MRTKNKMRIKYFTSHSPHTRIKVFPKKIKFTKFVVQDDYKTTNLQQRKKIIRIKLSVLFFKLPFIFP